MSDRLWILHAAADGAVAGLARGAVRWDVALFAPGLPVVLSAAGELRVLHAGGFWAGEALPVPRIDPGLYAAWLAQAINATPYRTEAGFARALARRQDRARALRRAAYAWSALDRRPLALAATRLCAVTGSA